MLIFVINHLAYSIRTFWLLVIVLQLIFIEDYFHFVHIIILFSLHKVILFVIILFIQMINVIIILFTIKFMFVFILKLFITFYSYFMIKVEIILMTVFPIRLILLLLILIFLREVFSTLNSVDWIFTSPLITNQSIIEIFDFIKKVCFFIVKHFTYLILMT